MSTNKQCDCDFYFVYRFVFEMFDVIKPLFVDIICDYYVYKYFYLYLVTLTYFIVFYFMLKIHGSVFLNSIKTEFTTSIDHFL